MGTSHVMVPSLHSQLPVDKLHCQQGIFTRAMDEPPSFTSTSFSQRLFVDHAHYWTLTSGLWRCEEALT